MKIALALLLVLSGCAHLGPAASCVADPALVLEVVIDLQATDYEARLEALAARVGLCVVDRTVEASMAPAGAEVSPVLVAHARAWLAAHPA